MEVSSYFSQTAFFVLCIVASYITYKILSIIITFFRKPKKANEKQRIFEILEKANKQNENFEIRVVDNALSKEYAAQLHGIDDKALKFRINADIPDDVKGGMLEVYFSAVSVTSPGKKEFLKFKCTVLSVEKRKDISFIRTTFPVELESGQKRSFYRIAPLPDTIKTLAMWILPPGYKLPTNTDDIGNPFVFSQDGQNADQIKIYDISASGIGLELDVSLSDEHLEKEGEILCFIVFNEYGHGSDGQNFCAIGRITNMRPIPEDKNRKIIGVEFLDWSVLRKDDKKIEWFHIKKGTGVSPILKRIARMKSAK